MAGMEIHEAALIFPIDEEHVAELGRDIAKNGLRVPIETLDGKVIDGRRRLRACELADVKPAFVEIETDDPIAYVVSLNLHRRHLTESQRGMVGARAKKMYEEQAKERQRESGKVHGRGKVPVNLPEPISGDARDLAGKAVGVSGRTIDYGRAVLNRGTPALIAAVDQDRLAISTAARSVGLPAEEQNKLAESAKGTRRCARRNEFFEPDPEPSSNGKLKGVGVIRANEAVNCLIRIPKNDALRRRGFQIVTDWIKANK